MRLLVIALVVALLVMVHPVLAIEKLNTSDFKEPDVTLTINGVDYKPTLSNGEFVVDKVCERGDQVEVSYLVEPVDSSAAKIVGGRTYTIRTELALPPSEPAISGYVYYLPSGGGISFSSSVGKSFIDIKVVQYDEASNAYALDQIKVNTTGAMPAPSSRLQEVRVVWFDIQEAKENCLPPVVLLVVDYNKFQSDMNSIKARYNNISAVLDEYIGKVDTSTLSNYLDSASKNESLAETYYSDKDYLKADERLKFASEWLDKADTEAKKVRAEYACDQADKKLKEVGSTLDKIDLYLAQVESNKLVNTSTLLNYKANFKSMQDESNTLSEDLTVAKAYLTNEKYSEAEIKANNILNKAEELASSSNTLFEELKKVVSPGETAVPKTTSQPFKMPNIDFKLVGIVIGGAIAVAAATIGVRKYMRRRKWDELK